MDLQELQLEKTRCSLSVPILSSFSVLHAYSTCAVLCRDGWNVQWEHRPSCRYVWYHQVHFHSMWVDGSDSTESESWRLVKICYFLLCPFASCLWAGPAFWQHTMHFSCSSSALTQSLPWLFRMVVTESHTAVSILIRGLKYLQLQYTGPQRTIDSFLKV